MRRRRADRRGSTRFEIVGELWGSIEARSPIVVRNLGSRGALLESPVPLAPGSMHWLTWRVGGEPQSLHIRVRHATPGEGRARYLAGVEFVTLTPAMEAFLREQVGAGGGSSVDPA